MSGTELFTTGNGGLIPEGDAARQAIDSLRGYAYQVIAAALAWIDIEDRGKLFLEVAEDYAIVARDAFEAVQVKDTEISGAVTLSTESVRGAIATFVSLKARNPNADVQLRYFTTSPIGTEKAANKRPGGFPGLQYWRSAAKGADIAPLRTILESDQFAREVQEFVKERDDKALRTELLSKIHWDCGKPDLTGLRKEFEDRLVLIGRDLFKLAAPEARRIADVLIYRVLATSIGKTPEERALSRADLYSEIDAATRVMVPRSVADTMMTRVSADIAASTLGDQSGSLSLANEAIGWLFESGTLPAVKPALERIALQASVGDRLREFGTSILFGTSGVGKSSIARLVARDLADAFVMIDFRDADAQETRSRLNTVVARVGGMKAPILILEDLNHLDDPLVGPSLARVLEAVRRRDRSAIVTCYLQPTARAISNVGLNVGCTVECPYFTQEETSEFVGIFGGDPDIWGRLAFAAGGFGHPQLVHAFIAGVSARGWPRGEIRGIVERGLSSGEVETEREAARRSLVSSLPSEARKLLYRLSLTMGRFDRAMALAIADSPPPIQGAGENLDILIGPWLEALGRNSYRVSPLAAQSGSGMISEPEQRLIHSAIATQFMKSGSINASDVDAILLHAMSGKNDGVLFRLARSILTSGGDTVELIAQNLTTFKLLRTDKPTYPDNPRLSVILRLTQFKILAAAQEGDKIADCASALFSAIEQEPEAELRRALRAMSFSVVLGTMGIADYLPNWLDLLQQFQKMTEADEFLSGLRAAARETALGSADLFGILFAIGTSGISSVAQLEHVINQLDGIEPSLRSQYLNTIETVSPDYSVFINTPWTSEHQRNAVNAMDAAERYRQMAAKTEAWGNRLLSIQCSIAQAVMLDEYAEDSEGALAMLDEAVARFGEDVRLLRARAKIHWRAHDYRRALSILHNIADAIGLDNLIERAFALREAAISAAKCGDWIQAEAWFVESQQAASQSELPDMKVMGVGLGADAAVAAIQSGSSKRGLTELCETLSNLAKIDPASSLRAFYCHQVVRHTILWARARMDGDTEFGAPATVEPGCCSNPEPPEAIAERRLAPFDFAWYLLALSELASGEPIGIAETLQERLTGPPIPIMEFMLRMARLRHAIVHMRANNFARDLWSYVEVEALQANQKERMATQDIFNPIREEIPQISRKNLADPALSAIAKDAVIAYAIAAGCRLRAERLVDLQTALDLEFGSEVPAEELVARAVSPAAPSPATSFDEALIDAIKLFRNGVNPAPQDCFMAGLRFFQQARVSNFKGFLLPLIGASQRKLWGKIAASERFRLSRPLQTVPAVEAALADPKDDESFFATLFLATSDAVGMTIPNELRSILKELANAEEKGL